MNCIRLPRFKYYARLIFHDSYEKTHFIAILFPLPEKALGHFCPRWNLCWRANCYCLHSVRWTTNFDFSCDKLNELINSLTHLTIHKASLNCPIDVRKTLMTCLCKGSFRD